MLRRFKLRREYDQKLLELMESTKAEWLNLLQLEDLSYEENEELKQATLLAKSKYFFLFHEAKKRKISVK